RRGAHGHVPTGARTMIKNAWSWLADDPRHRVGVRVLQVAIGAMLMFRVLTELPFAAYLWGPHGIGLSGNPSYFGPWLAGKLDVIFHSMAGTYAVLGAVALAAVGLVSGRHTRAATVLALFATLMLERRLPEVLDGGDNITRLTLTYMLFLLPADAKPVRRSLGVWVHNIAVVAIMAQLVVLYATSGIMKAAGERWHHGTALYVVSQVEWFSVPWVRSIFKNPFMTTIATYSTLLFQLWFPMAIFSRFKLVWLAAGIFFHLNIAIVMGLVTFSTVMIGLELFLITDEEFASLQAAGRRIVAGALERLGLGRVAEPQILLYIDGHCAHCRRAGEALRQLGRCARAAHARGDPGDGRGGARLRRGAGVGPHDAASVAGASAVVADRSRRARRARLRLAGGATHHRPRCARVQRRRVRVAGGGGRSARARGGVMRVRTKVSLALLAAIALASAATFVGRGRRHEQAPAAAAAVGATGRARLASSTLPPLSPIVDAAHADPLGTLRLEGQVIDAEQQPVGGATVVLSTVPPRSVRSEADGSFVFTGLAPRTLALSASVDERVAGPAVVALTERTEPVILRVQGATTVEVLAFDVLTQRAIAGATVEVREPLPMQATTGVRGVARLRGVGAGPHQVVVTAPGYAPSFPTLVSNGRPGTVQSLVVTMHPGGAVSGRVVDAEGHPVAGATVTGESAARGEPLVDARAAPVTDAEGRWRIAAVAAGTVRFAARDGHHAPGSSALLSVDGKAARDDVEIVMSRG